MCMGVCGWVRERENLALRPWYYLPLATCFDLTKPVFIYINYCHDIKKEIYISKIYISLLNLLCVSCTYTQAGTAGPLTQRDDYCPPMGQF